MLKISYYWVLLQKVENRVRILADLRDLASAESLDSFTLVYTNILEHQSDCPVNSFTMPFFFFFFFLILFWSLFVIFIHSIMVGSKEIRSPAIINIYPIFYCILQPEVVEKLVALREGIPRKEAKEVRIVSTSGKTMLNMVYMFWLPVTHKGRANLLMVCYL